MISWKVYDLVRWEIKLILGIFKKGKEIGLNISTHTTNLRFISGNHKNRNSVLCNMLAMSYRKLLYF